MKVLFKTHMNDFYSTIYSKEIYPVAINPLDVKKSCISEINIKQKEHYSRNSKYLFKDIVCEFVELKLE